MQCWIVYYGRRPYCFRSISLRFLEWTASCYLFIPTVGLPVMSTRSRDNYSPYQNSLKLQFASTANFSWKQLLLTKYGFKSVHSVLQGMIQHYVFLPGWTKLLYLAFSCGLFPVYIIYFFNRMFSVWATCWWINRLLNNHLIVDVDVEFIRSKHCGRYNYLMLLNWTSN